MANKLEHLELTGCEQLSEYGLEALFKNFRNIQFFDINHIPVVNAAFFEVLKNTRPDVMVRRYQFNDIDVKDNMLRVPLRIVSKDKKKKGKKKLTMKTRQKRKKRRREKKKKEGKKQKNK